MTAQCATLSLLPPPRKGRHRAHNRRVLFVPHVAHRHPATQTTLQRTACASFRINARPPRRLRSSIPAGPDRSFLSCHSHFSYTLRRWLFTLAAPRCMSRHVGDPLRSAAPRRQSNDHREPVAVVDRGFHGVAAGAEDAEVRGLGAALVAEHGLGEIPVRGLGGGLDGHFGDGGPWRPPVQPALPPPARGRLALVSMSAHRSMSTSKGSPSASNRPLASIPA